MARQAVAEQWLLASATSEAAAGGDLRRSEAALKPDPLASQRFLLTKDAITVSYGRAADLLLITAKRSPEAQPTDQVLVVVQPSEASVEQTGHWAPLGMRGTNSPGLRITASVSADRILPVPFGDIAASTMVPLTQTLWAATWLGLAAEALARAVRFARRRMAKGAAAGRVQPALAEARWRIATIEALVNDMAQRTQDVLDGKVEPTVGLTVSTNSLKVAVSETALEVAYLALRVCGMAGYSEEGPFSVARIIRDLSSSLVMINNDRLLDTTSQLMLMERPLLR